MSILSARDTRKRIQRFHLEKKSAFGFAFQEKAVHLAYDWHSHSRHQLLYSLSGRIILRSRDARWLLPPQRAAWIPAGVKHQTTLDRSDTISVFFTSVPRNLQLKDIRIIRSNWLLREMLLYSSRWPAQKQLPGSEKSLCKSYFETLAFLCLDWIQQELPFRLPAPKEPAIEKAVNYLLKNLDFANMKGAAQASAQSIRTLRRRFLPATGLTWQQYALQARMLQAMDALLTTRQSVIEIGYSVGYNSPSAFAKAFAQFSGSTPLAFRNLKVSPSFHL
jgi:AraC-like DNA-binding protein/quercetin dioxygenase-like cupin family protein